MAGAIKTDYGRGLIDDVVEKALKNIGGPPEGFTITRCRLCNEPWYIPNQYVDQLNSDHGYECIYCRKRVMNNGR